MHASQARVGTTGIEPLRFRVRFTASGAGVIAAGEALGFVDGDGQVNGVSGLPLNNKATANVFGGQVPGNQSVKMLGLGMTVENTTCDLTEARVKLLKRNARVELRHQNRVYDMGHVGDFPAEANNSGDGVPMRRFAKAFTVKGGTTQPVAFAVIIDSAISGFANNEVVEVDALIPCGRAVLDEGRQ